MSEFQHFLNKDKYVSSVDSNWKRFRMCSRKKVYTLKADAINTLHKLYGMHPKHMHVYECSFCHFYHLGHKKNAR